MSLELEQEAEKIGDEIEQVLGRVISGTTHVQHDVDPRTKIPYFIVQLSGDYTSSKMLDTVIKPKIRQAFVQAGYPEIKFGNVSLYKYRSVDGTWIYVYPEANNKKGIKDNLLQSFFDTALDNRQSTERVDFENPRVLEPIEDDIVRAIRARFKRDSGLLLGRTSSELILRIEGTFSNSLALVDTLKLIVRPVLAKHNLGLRDLVLLREDPTIGRSFVEYTLFIRAKD